MMICIEKSRSCLHGIFCFKRPQSCTLIVFTRQFAWASAQFPNQQIPTLAPKDKCEAWRFTFPRLSLKGVSHIRFLHCISFHLLLLQTETNHQLNGLKTTQIYYFIVLRGQKSKTGLMGLKSSYQQDCVPLGTLGESLFISFASFSRLPAFLVLWPPSSNGITLTSASVVTFPSLIQTPLSTS